MSEIYDFEKIKRAKERRRNNSGNDMASGGEQLRGKKAKGINRRLRKLVSALVVLFVLCIILVCGFIANKSTLKLDVPAFLSSLADHAKGLNAESGSVIQADSDEWVKYCPYKNYIIQCKSGEVSYYDINLNSIHTNSINMRNPVAKSSEKYLAVGEIEGKEINLFLDKNKAANISYDTSERKIVNFDVAENGYVTVVTDSIKGNNDVFLYDETGEEMSNIHYDSEFVLEAKYNIKDKQIYINRLDTSKGEANTVIDVFLPGKKEEQAEHKRSIGNLPGVFPFWSFTESGGVYCYSEEAFLGFDKKGEGKWSFSFSSGVYGCCIIGQKTPVVVQSEYDETAGKYYVAVNIYNPSGELKKTYKHDGDIKSVFSIEDLVCLNTGYEVLFIGADGELRGRADCEREIKKVLTVRNNTVLFEVSNGIVKG